MTAVLRCAHGRPRAAVDGTGCWRCEPHRCQVCGERVSDALLALGIRTHPTCEPGLEPDEPDDDPRSLPWWQR